MWQAKYSVQTDPTVEEVKDLCLWCRQTAKNERVLFHYNGHGVPQPTSNGEIWVFNKVRKNTVPLWCIVFCTAGKWRLEIITDWWWCFFCAEFHNIHTTVGLWVGIMAWKPIHLCVWLFSRRHDCKRTLWGKTVYILSSSFFCFSTELWKNWCCHDTRSSYCLIWTWVLTAARLGSQWYDGCTCYGELYFIGCLWSSWNTSTECRSASRYLHILSYNTDQDSIEMVCAWYAFSH